jgi:hypothetical protein
MIFDEGVNFLYVTVVADSIYGSGGDMEPFKSYLFDTYNYAAYPTCLFDGGYDVFVGGYPQLYHYRDRIIASGARAVQDLDFTVSMEWLGSGSIQINVDITNNEYENYAPDITGPALGRTGVSQDISCTGIDPNRHQIYYKFDWGDGDISDWLGPYDYGVGCTQPHTWNLPGDYEITVQTKDIYEALSEWSSPGSINIWTCGDFDDDGQINILDIVATINYKYKGGAAPSPLNSMDVNNDSDINILDIVALINYKYKSGAPPECPES